MTTDARTLLEQALDALDADHQLGAYHGLCEAIREYLEAGQADHAAEQPEPVAWLYRGGGSEPIATGDYEWHLRMGPTRPNLGWANQELMPVYTAPPAPAAQQATAALVPPGYVLVPVEPTPEMLEAAFAAYMASDFVENKVERNIYCAMLAARPGASDPLEQP